MEYETQEGRIEGVRPAAAGRARVVVDLTAHPDVADMFGRAVQEIPGVSKTYLVIESLRAYLRSRGYDRKRDGGPPGLSNLADRRRDASRRERARKLAAARPAPPAGAAQPETKND